MKTTNTKANRQEQTPMERWHRLKEYFIRESDDIFNATGTNAANWIDEMMSAQSILEIGDAYDLNESR